MEPPVRDEIGSSFFPRPTEASIQVGTTRLTMGSPMNAVRLRTEDGRYIHAVGSANLLVAATISSPGTDDTFLFEPPAMVPPASGGGFSIAAITPSNQRTSRVLRVEHNTVTGPYRRKSPTLVTYEVGGPGTRVLVSPPFGAGYPGYPGDDPSERVLAIVRMQGAVASAPGTPIATGDRVCLRIDSNRGQTFFAKVANPADGAELRGDGTTLGQTGTVFVVELLDVQPTTVPVVTCGSVTALVTRASSGAALSGATCTIAVPQGIFTAVSGSDGRTPDLAGASGACVPVGPAQLVAAADRFQTKSTTVTVGTGAQEVPVSLECTLVRGRVIDGSGVGLVGIPVNLRDRQRVPILDENGVPYRTTTGAGGSFEFRCVPHAYAQVFTTAAPAQLQHERDIPPEGWTNVTIVIASSQTCGDLVGLVVDAQTGAPIVGATVTESGGRQTTTDAQGRFRFACVLPAGANTVYASALGYPEGVGTGSVPPGGDSAEVLIRLSRPTVSDLRLILDWGMQPADLDLHLSGPDGASGRFHCFFAARNPVPWAEIGPDDTTGTGPEVTSVFRVPPGPSGSFVAGDYHVWVHNFSGPTYAASAAAVTIVVADPGGSLTQLARYVVTSAMGDPQDRLWHVFDFTIDAAGNVTRTDVQTLSPGVSTDVL
jgi:uncharacterized protein YfaP (DUF2135 family)